MANLATMTQLRRSGAGSGSLLGAGGRPTTQIDLKNSKGTLARIGFDSDDDDGGDELGASEEIDSSEDEEDEDNEDEDEDEDDESEEGKTPIKRKWLSGSLRTCSVAAELNSNY